MHVHTAIIGGGITGLATGWYLQNGHIPYAIIERENHWGGKIQTKRYTHDDGSTFIMDAGPESFITRKAEVWELAQALGLADEIITPTNESRGVGVLYQSKIYPLPIGIGSFIGSKLLSSKAKLRLLAEPFIKPRLDDADETIASFAERRLGQEVMERMIAPILGGIYNTDPHQQSILISAPQMREMEQVHGGLFKGLLASIRKPSPKDAPPRFMAFRNGADVLVTALTQQLTGKMCLNTGVERIDIQGTGYRLVLSNGETLSADHIVLATTANIASQLIETLSPIVAQQLREFRHSSIGTMFLAYRRVDLPNEPIVRGLMIPRREQRAIDAVLWTSYRMPHRAPADYVMLKVFFGGSQPDMVTCDEATRLARVQQELAQLFDIHVEPIFQQSVCWENAYPQANVGHLERVANAEADLPQGIFLAGSAYRGIGVPDCIRQGKQVAKSIIQSQKMMEGSIV